MATQTKRRNVRRYSLDMDKEQLRFLKLFALQIGQSASAVMRVLIYLLETENDVQYAVIDEIYPIEGEPLDIVTNRSRKGRSISRFTLDLHNEQSKYLKFISINQNIDASVILRVMIFLLERNFTLDGEPIQDIVISELEYDAKNETETPEGDTEE